MKTILLIGGGIETISGVDQLHEMGLRVVVVDRDPNCPCRDIADDILVASTYDVQAVVEQAWGYHQLNRRIDAVMCLATDVPITAYEVAHVLDLPNIGWYAAAVGADKLLMKMILATAGVLVPHYVPVYSYAGLDRFRNDVYSRGSSWVVKPVDSRGARGVIRLLPDISNEWAYEHAREQSPSGRVMAEHWIDGIQISVEGVVLNAVYHNVAIIDRNYDTLDRFAPYVIENGGQQPSVLTATECTAVVSTMQAAASAMGMFIGTLKGDLVVQRKKNGRSRVYVIEVAPRLSGGHMSTAQIPLATGVHLVQIAAQLALGRTIDPAEIESSSQRAVAIRYQFPDGPVTSHPERGRHEIAVADTVEEAVRLAELAVRNEKDSANR